MLDDLTQKQAEVLLFIKSEVQRKGYPPSVREICKGVNIKSTSTVYTYLNQLESQGYIRKDPTKPRAIEIIRDNNQYLLETKKTIDVPILGKVTAGEPILAIENIESTYPVCADLIEDSNVFILKVNGNSMVNAGIIHGDLILVKQQTSAMNGDIIVALIEDEATVKRFFKEKNKIRLKPENDFMKSNYYDNISILGKVIGLYREI